MEVYDRQLGKIVNTKETQDKSVKILYNTRIGGILLKLVSKRFFSKAYGIFYKSRLSKSKIRKFVKSNNIDITDISKFKTFNDFFIRRRKDLNIDISTDSLISPAQSKLSIYKISDDTRAIIKGVKYSIAEIVNSQDIADGFTGGICLVFRLSTTDYHRYIFIDDGYIEKTYEIDGDLHTVRDESSRYRVYATNHRIVSILNSKSLGRYIQVEVGALTVGKIVNHSIVKHSKGDEKGYFEYGGSTIVMLFRPNIIKIDTDIEQINDKGIEIKIQIGERIGQITNE